MRTLRLAPLDGLVLLVLLAACAGILVVSIQPGNLDFLSPYLFVGAPVGVVIGPIVLAMMLDPGRSAPKQPTHPAWWVGLVVVVVATVSLWWSGTLARLVFQAHRAAFEELVAAAPDEGSPWLVRESCRIGPYEVSVHRGDADHGIYFQTGYAQFVFAGERFGFAYRPRGEGTPFGDAPPQLTPLGGDWYAFAVSDDDD